MLKFMDDTGRAPDRAARTAEGRNAHRGALPPPVAVPGAIGKCLPLNAGALLRHRVRPRTPRSSRQYAITYPAIADMHSANASRRP